MTSPPPTRRTFGSLAVGSLVLGLTGALSWKYAAWSSPHREPVVFLPGGEGGGVEQQGQVLLLRDGDSVRALSARCTHLGCTVTLAADGESLVCPCHGSEYDLEGNVVGGPAPRPLQVLEVEHLEDGSCVVVPV